MKLVISDIHNRVDWIESCIEDLSPNFVIFLGDYFDHLNDKPENAKHTAQWLKQSLAHPNRNHLIGNHDISYMFSLNPDLFCPGYTADKCRAIFSVMTHDDFDKLNLVHMDEHFIYSHAGICEELFFHPIYGFSKMGVIDMCNHALRNASENVYNPILCAGLGRGSLKQKCGGILWKDWNSEFKPITNINQIVGHTIVNTPEVLYKFEMGTIKKHRFGKIETTMLDEHKPVSININMDTNNNHLLCVHDNGEYEIIENKWINQN